MNTLLDKVVYPDSYAGRRDRLILETLYSTGIRAAELLGLDIDDVDVVRNDLTVRGYLFRVSDHQQVTCVSKGKPKACDNIGES